MRRGVAVTQALSPLVAQCRAAEMPDLSAIGPFTFDAARYDVVLADAVDTLRGLAGEDEAAVADWRRRHSRRGRARLLLTRAARP